MEQVKENKKKNFIIIIILLVVVNLGLVGYIVYDKFNEKKEESSENTEKLEEIEKDNKENNEEVNSVITKEEAENFLNELVSDSVTVDLLISNTDEEVFMNSIRYLSLKEKYTKNGNDFIFKQSDIVDLARKYYMKDNFDYIYNNTNFFVYDSTNKTYQSGLNFGLFSSSPSFEKTKTIENFSYESGVASLTYNVKVTYDASLVADNVSIRNYHIKLIKVNEELRIKSISE